MTVKSNKDVILKTACRLFYLNGYEHTTLEEIASLSLVKKQAITYHFGSKSGLGVAVTLEYGNNNRAAFDEAVEKINNKEHPFSDLEISAAYLLWFADYYNKDPKAFAFFKEFIFTDISFNFLVEAELSANYKTFGLSGIKLSDRIKTVSAFYAGKGLLYQYSVGLLDCSKEKFAKYYYYNYYSPFINDKKELERIYEEACKIMKDLPPLNMIDYNLPISLNK